MSRVQLYHGRTKPFHWKLPIFFLLLMTLILTLGVLIYQHYDQSTIKTETSKEDSGRKVVVSLPNGQEVFTYDKFIVKKGNKTYYKGERNTIDLTGGKVEYKDW